MKSLNFNQGQVILREGDPGRDLYLLTEGRVEVSSRSRGGDTVLNEIEAPALFGEISSILEGVPRTATARAMTRVTVFALEQEEVQEQMAALPQWLKPVLQTLADRACGHERKIQELEVEILRLTGGPPPRLED